MPFPTKQQMIDTLIKQFTPEEVQQAEHLAKTGNPMFYKLIFRLLPECINCKKQLNHKIIPNDKQSLLCVRCKYTHKAGTMRQYHPELEEEE